MKKPPSLGTAFENSIKLICEAYEQAGLATLEKTDPPTKSFSGGKGKPPRIIHLTNPFLDFTGTWSERGGKFITLECKYTSDQLLEIGDKGIKPSQLKAALRWQDRGAAVAFLWRCQTETRFITPRMVVAQLRDRKSVPWHAAHKIPQGKGFIFIDFLALFRQLYPETKTQTP